MFQSAPPHGGRLASADEATTWPARSVSIRAPARGATRTSPTVVLGWRDVSIRAPARGATCRCGLVSADVSIRAPARGATSDRRPFAYVSIRAPARGATSLNAGWTMINRDRLFQSAPPHGGRLRHPSRMRVKLFQSAPPHGGRLSTERQHDAGHAHVSIRAPARGATYRQTEGLRRDWAIVSIRAPARGARWHHRDRVSIRAPARGATRPRPSMAAQPSICCAGFQSAPPHGGRLLGGTKANTNLMKVSIRAPARGATRGTAPYSDQGAVSIRAPARGATVCALTALKGYI